MAFANEAADRAAEIALSHFAPRVATRLKEDGTPVTEADLSIEAMFREGVARRFPNDTIVGEEQGWGARAERTWVIDPIDETKNFAAGIQVWGTLIALAVDGTPILGIVSAPRLGERYEAVLGEGARLNGEAIRVSAVDTLSEALLIHSGLKEQMEPPLERPFRHLVDKVKRTRGFGGFWGHVLVARGSADIMVEPELALWDWAAPKVVVEEAGGRMTALDGSPPRHASSVLTTNGAVHHEVVELFREPEDRR